MHNKQTNKSSYGINPNQNRNAVQHSQWQALSPGCSACYSQQGRCWLPVGRACALIPMRLQGALCRRLGGRGDGGRAPTGGDGGERLCWGSVGPGAPVRCLETAS